MKLFHVFSVFDSGAGKHLEAIGKWYDLFRSKLHVPVVLPRAMIHAQSHARDTIA